MKKQILLLFTTVITLALLKSAAAVSVFPLLEKYIKQQQYAKAYQRATSLHLEYEGDPRFDYLYGLAALQTGHYNEAVFSLDRVTINTPNVIRPRLELARAYLSLNNHSAAIKEFNDVLSLSPPPVVRQKVQAYIAELQKKSDKKTRKSVTKSLASFSIGYDDNINFGSSESEIDLPSFGLINLDPSAVKQGSGFAESKFQLKHRRIQNKIKSTFVLANLTHKKYFKDSDFNLTDLDLSVGMTINKQKKQYQFIARTRPIMLDGDFYANTYGLDAVARKALGKGAVASVKLSLEKYDNKELSLSDRSRAILTGSLDKQIADIQHQFNVYLGKESPDEKDGKQFSRDISGLGYLGVKEWTERNRSYVGLDYRYYRHQDNYPVYPDKKRRDDRVSLKFGHEWQINDNISLNFSAKHTKNNSNLDLYDADRNEVKVGLRYDWD